MPQLFDINGYKVYFWSNENMPLEPIHVHVTKGKPTRNGTKVWITSSGHALLCSNGSRIPSKTLSVLLRMIEANSSIIIEQWKEHFEEISFYC